MEADEDSSPYFMEVYDQIRSISLVLRDIEFPKQLHLKPQKIIAKHQDGTSNVYPLVVNIEPESYTSVRKYANEGIGIRLQLRDDTPEPQTSFLTTAVKRVGNEIQRMEQSVCQCGCKTCGLFLFVDNIKFNRVLPLPSQTWRDMFNNWSCCSHSQGQTTTPGYVTKTPLKPREGDCLLDDFSILVHSKTIEKRNVSVTNKKHKSSDSDSKKVRCVKCSRCRADLGIALSYEKEIETYKLNKSNIEVLALKTSTSEVVPRPIFFSEFFLERLLAQQLSDAVHTHSTHLFVIQDAEGNIYLLIRVINTMSRLFVNNGKSNTEVPISEKEVLSKPMQNGDGIQKSIVKSETPLTCHDGAGDSPSVHKVAFEKAAGKKEGDESEKSLNNGRPWVQGSQVADVIERLFSFSTHLISIGRTCGDERGVDASGCERIVKVLFAATFDKKSRNKLGLKWLRDDRTVTLSYPKNVCIQMLLILISSSLTMPLSHRVLDDFLCGFLRLD